MVNLTSDELPVVAEVFMNGETVLAEIVSFQHISQNDQSLGMNPPKAIINVPNTVDTSMISNHVIDFGQITTVWRDPAGSLQDVMKSWNQVRSKAKLVPSVDKALDKLYYSYVGRSRQSSTTLTKNGLKQILKTLPEAENVLRASMKAGTNLSRVLDSEKASNDMFEHKSNLRTRSLTAALLSLDSQTGGRFKRWPCVYVGLELNGEESINSISFLNGGWVVTDRSVRIGQDATKFVERIDEKVGPQTASDERILRRMECLAMGEWFKGEDDRQLELDVKETLGRMNVEVSSEGAKEALVRIGYWTGKENFTRFQPWSEEVLISAKEYVEKRQQSDCLSKGRADLRHVPVVCIDLKETTFRDDAIGLRDRKSTGRKVFPEASKWEVLVHIADTSDLYVEPGRATSVLRKAAEARGMSRYDLPFGPLHLLPPVVLETIAFSKGKQNLAVTMWAYIDERTGKIIDSGFERSIVNSPIFLTYEEAQRFLAGALPNDAPKSVLQIRKTLSVVDRILARWSTRHMSMSSTARRRREKTINENHPDGDIGSLLAKNRFLGTQSFRLVDDALSLYGEVASRQLHYKKAPIPMVAGAHVRNGGRLATGPLRRYVDGQSQRQIVSVLCSYGSPLSLEECQAISHSASITRNSLANVKASRVK